jgi:hypothetical protein
MNKFQRTILIGIGLTIAVVQLVGIADHGLDENKGWAVSLLIAAALLFIGFGTSFDWLNQFRKPRNTTPVAPSSPNPPIAPPSKAVENRPRQPAPGKYDFGVHISELDIAIEAHRNYAERCKIDVSIQGNGRSLNWNCCMSVYASMRLAALKAQMRIHSGTWNTVVRAIVIRMATEEVEGVGIGDREFQALEAEAYSDLERINKAVEDALSGQGKFLVEPIANVLAQAFGTRSAEPLKALSAMILINAETAHKKILPEMLADLA